MPAVRRATRHDPPGEGVALPGLNGDAFFEFALAPQAPFPLVVLDDGDLHSRTVLGRLRFPQRELLEIAVDLQRDDYDDGDAARPGASNNLEVDRLMARRVEAMSQLGLRGAGTPASFDLAGREADVGKLPPLLLCVERKTAFRPACPECGAPLVDLELDGEEARARANAALHAAGVDGRVRGYRDSLERYLSCVACWRQGTEAPLYAVRLPDGRDAADFGGPTGPVRDATTYFEDFAAAVMTGGKLIDGPCAACPQRKECMTDDGAPEARPYPKHLRRLSFHAFRISALERHDLAFHHAAHLLGGRDGDDVLREFADQGRPAAAAARLRAVVLPAFARRDARWFAGKAGGLLAAETLLTKLLLAADLVRSLRVVHREHGPHLALRPERAVVRAPLSPPAAPLTWNLAVRLVGVGEARLAVQPEPGERATIWQPAGGVPAEFASPRLDPSAFLSRRNAQVRIASVETTANGKVVLNLDVRFEFRSAVDQIDLRRRDVVDLQLQAGAARPVRLTCRPLRDGALGMGSTANLRTTPFVPGPALPALRAAADHGAWLPKQPCTLMRSFDVDCDAYSVGVMILQALFEGRDDDGCGAVDPASPRGVVAIRRSAERLLRDVERACVDDGATGDRTRCDAIALAALAHAGPSGESGDTWHAAQRLFFRRTAGSDAEAAQIAPTLVNRATLAALKSMAELPGLAYRNDDAPDAALAELSSDLERLVDECRDRLLGASMLADTLVRVADDLQFDIRQRVAEAPLQSGPADELKAVECVERLWPRLLEEPQYAGDDRPAYAERLAEIVRSELEGASALQQSTVADLLKARVGRDAGAAATGTRRATRSHETTQDPRIPEFFRELSMALEEEVPEDPALLPGLGRILGATIVEMDRIPATAAEQQRRRDAEYWSSDRLKDLLRDMHAEAPPSIDRIKREIGPATSAAANASRAFSVALQAALGTHLTELIALFQKREFHLREMLHKRNPKLVVRDEKLMPTFEDELKALQQEFAEPATLQRWLAKRQLADRFWRELERLNFAGARQSDTRDRPRG